MPTDQLQKDNMKRTICITTYHDMPTAFLLEDGLLMEVHPLRSSSRLGQIVAATVEKVVPSLSAAFLEIKGEKPLYYPLNENEDRHIFIRHGKKDRVAAGDVVLVQIQREPIKQKLALASADLTLTGETVIVNRTGVCGISSKITDPAERAELSRLGKALMEEAGDDQAGLIFRTAAETADEETVREETIKLLCKQKEIIQASRYAMSGSVLYEQDSPLISDIRGWLGRCREDRLEAVTDIPEIYGRLISAFSAETEQDRLIVSLYEDENLSLCSLFDLPRQVEQALKKTVVLKSGGNLVIEPTEALTVIDVNTAKAIRGHSMEETFRKINREAAKMAARQIRLRNLSGIILIDFINMKKEENTEELIGFLRSELAKDPGRAVFHDVTKLGLCEITRKKVSPPLHEIYR